MPNKIEYDIRVFNNDERISTQIVYNLKQFIIRINDIKTYDNVTHVIVITRVNNNIINKEKFPIK